VPYVLDTDLISVGPGQPVPFEEIAEDLISSALVLCDVLQDTGLVFHAAGFGTRLRIGRGLSRRYGEPGD